jgi:hypothetical protein
MILVLSSLFLLLGQEIQCQIYHYQNLKCAKEVESDDLLNLTLLNKEFGDIPLYCIKYRTSGKVALIVDKLNADSSFVFSFDTLGVLASCNYRNTSRNESVVLRFDPLARMDKAKIKQVGPIWKEYSIKHRMVYKITDHYSREGTRSYFSMTRIPKDILRMYKTCLDHYEKNMGEKLECSIR